MSAYSDAHKKIMLHSEAVMTLKGTDCEEGVIMTKYAEFKKRTSILFGGPSALLAVTIEYLTAKFVCICSVLEVWSN